MKYLIENDKKYLFSLQTQIDLNKSLIYHALYEKLKMNVNPFLIKSLLIPSYDGTWFRTK